MPPPGWSGMDSSKAYLELLKKRKEELLAKKAEKTQ